MNDYFDQFERSVGTALISARHVPWYSRLGRIRHARALAAVFGALLVATPAVGAVSDCFGACVHIPTPSATSGQGAPLPGTSRLLSLRVADPQGGPVTAADVATPINVTLHAARSWCLARHSVANAFNEIPCDGTVPTGYTRFYPGFTRGRAPDPGVLVDVSFTARRAVTTSSSGYGLTLGHTGFSSVDDVRRGETLRYQDFIPDSRPDTYQGVVTYTPSSRSPNEVAGGGPAGPGSVVVGRFSVTVP